jgi:ketosteroid isomerase-like protein
MSHPPIHVRCAAVLLTGLLMTQPLAAQKHAKRLEREQVAGMDEQWRSAILADDAGSMDKLLSDDYLGITGAGQAVTKMQQLDRMRSRSLALTRIDLSDVKIKVLGQVAIVTSIAELDGTMDSKPVHGAFRSTRVYQRLPGGTWKLTNFEATRVHRSRGPADMQPAADTH